MRARRDRLNTGGHTMHMTEEVSCKGMQDNNYYTKINEKPICNWTQSMSKIIKIMYKRKKLINLIKLTHKHVLYLYSFQSVVVFNESLSDFHLPHTSDRMNRLFVFFFLFGLSVWMTKSARTTMKLKCRQEGFERFSVWVSHCQSGAHYRAPVTVKHLVSMPYNSRSVTLI